MFAPCRDLAEEGQYSATERAADGEVKLAKCGWVKIALVVTIPNRAEFVATPTVSKR